MSSMKNAGFPTVSISRRKRSFCRERRFPTKAVIGIDVCEDLWVPIPPSSLHALAGANVIVNLSASNETIGKRSYRRSLVLSQSAKCYCGYVYCSANQQESTSDLVFSGHRIIGDNGMLISEADFDEGSEES